MEFKGVKEVVAEHKKTGAKYKIKHLNFALQVAHCIGINTVNNEKIVPFKELDFYFKNDKGDIIWVTYG